MERFKNKRLLFLGASMLDAHAIQYAKSLGIYTVVANFYPQEKSPSKRYADASYEVDIKDDAAMLSIIKKEKIDGIFGGYTDSHLVFYSHICELGCLPCYGTADLFNLSTDKNLFKKMCHENGVLTVEEVDSDSINEASDFPLFIKPADSSGSRGCSACYNYEQYKNSVKAALAFSPSGSITVEKYYDFRKYGDVMACYSIRDGKAVLASLGDRVLYQGAGNVSPLPAQLVYPSVYIDKYLETTDPLVIKMLQKNGFKNGTLFLQGFTDGEEFRFFEMGYRQNGSQQFVLTNHFNKTNALLDAFDFAFFGENNPALNDKDNANFATPACNLVIYLLPGTISRIEGLDSVLKMPEVINYTPWLLEGGTVGMQGTLAQSLCRFHVIGKDKEHLNSLIRKIRDTIKVYDQNHNNMVISL